MLLALVVLGGVEGTLRLAGYGGYPPTFKRVGTLPDGSTLVFTDHGGPTSYFFANRSNPGTLDRVAFVMPKPANTVRVMVVGGSAAKGIPQPRGLAWSSFMREMLSDLWPEKKVEVINLGTTAVASYPALGIMTEALEFDPDLVVVWVGNNEFYGAYGVASLHSAGRSPVMIRLVRASRSLALAQFIDRQLAPPEGAPSKALMEVMAGRSYIGPDDPARAAAARNLETFVGEMISRCKARSVPVVVCTPPANERDLAPLGAADLSSMEATERDRVRRLLEQSEAAIASDPAEAENVLNELVRLDPNHARAHYLMGRALSGLQRAEAAAEHFRRAVDLDPMPWRAPAQSVEAIRRAAMSGGVALCDLQRAFRAASAEGSIGWELMDDHVHPSLRGQELAARTVVRTIVDERLLPHPPSFAVDELPDGEEYARRLGANAFEDYAVHYAMRLLAQLPFYRESNPAFHARCDEACRRFEGEVGPEIREALRAWAEQPMKDGERRPMSGVVARALLRMGREAEAEPLFRLAQASVVPYSAWDLQYTDLMLISRMTARGSLDEAARESAAAAIRRGEFLLSSGQSDSGEAERFVGELHQLLEHYAESVPLLMAARAKLTGWDRVGTDAALVNAQIRLGRFDDARAVIDEGLRSGAVYVQVYSGLSASLQEAMHRR